MDSLGGREGEGSGSVQPQHLGPRTAISKRWPAENWLVVLCNLAQGKKTVTEPELSIGVRRPTRSQQLARLRAEALAIYRRQSYYRERSLLVLPAVAPPAPIHGTPPHVLFSARAIAGLSLGQ